MFKRISLIQNNSFLWKIYGVKKYNKNANTLLFLLLFTTGQREKKYWTNICECRRSKKVKHSGFREYFTAVSTES